jgi:GntR family transcriptional regulator
MATTPESFLAEPILTSPGLPLRVAVYSRLSQGIRSGVLEAGSILPRETELAVMLGVSRTVVREALMLLEEDGHIVTRRGIGRFIADTLPAPGLERLQSVESLLGSKGVDVTVISFTSQEPTDFVTDHVVVEPGSPSWFRESVLARDGQPLALVQEYTADAPQLAEVSPALGKAFARVLPDGPTMLSTLISGVGSDLTPGHCVITTSVAGPTRAGHLSIKASDPVLLVTQTALVNGVPVIVVKSAFTAEAGHLSVAQTGTSRSAG